MICGLCTAILAFSRCFPSRYLSGQREGLFRDPHQAVLTQSGARKIFGEANPIGQILNVHHEYDLEVVAVVQDFPEKSSLDGEIFCSAELRIQYSLTSTGDKEAYLYNIFLKFNPRTRTGVPAGYPDCPDTSLPGLV